MGTSEGGANFGAKLRRELYFYVIKLWVNRQNGRLMARGWAFAFRVSSNISDGREPRCLTQGDCRLAHLPESTYRTRRIAAANSKFAESRGDKSV